MIAIKVECECGEEFEIEINDKVYRSIGHYRESKMGQQHCPNPDCDKTVHINVNVYSCVELDEDEINPRIDWEETMVGNIIHFKGKTYKVALKATRKIISKELTTRKVNILYLRSEIGEHNLVLEVRKSGFLSSTSLNKLSSLSKEELDFLKNE